MKCVYRPETHPPPTLTPPPLPPSIHPSIPSSSLIHIHRIQRARRLGPIIDIKQLRSAPITKERTSLLRFLHLFSSAASWIFHAISCTTLAKLVISAVDITTDGCWCCTPAAICSRRRRSISLQYLYMHNSTAIVSFFQCRVPQDIRYDHKLFYIWANFPFPWQ